MMPEIKKFTNLNIEKELRKGQNLGDCELTNIIFEVSFHLLTDDDCVFVYDLAEKVSAKDIDCYLNQYWKEYWESVDDYKFLTPFIIKDLLKNKFLKYSAELSKVDHQNLFDNMFLTCGVEDYCTRSDCPYAE